MDVRRWLPVAAALALVLGACGSDEQDATVFGSEDLGTALLSATDVGAGFTEADRVVAETRPEGTPMLDPGMWCPAAGNVADDLAGLVGDSGAFVSIQAADVTGRNFHGVSEQLWSGPDAKVFVDRATTGFEACVGETWDLADEDGTASVAALAGETVGDDSTMAVVTYVTPGPDGDYAWRGRTLVARVGATVMVIQELDVQLVDVPPRFTDADWQRIVDVAADRIAALADR